MPHSYVVKILDDESVDDTYGEWCAIGHADYVCAHIDGIVSGDKVKLFISNIDPPVEATQVLHGSEITADSMVEIARHAKWIRAQLSDDAGAGTASASVYLNIIEHV